MNIQEYRQRQARSFYNHLRDATNPVFFYWQDVDNPMPQIGGEPRGVSGFVYQADNAIQLQMASKAQGFQSPLWLSYDQAKAAGGKVKSGEIGTKIVSWIGGKEGKPYEPILMTVFNADQISGLTLPKVAGLTAEQQAMRQAGLDVLITPRKKTPTLRQYNERLAELLTERFPGAEDPEANAQATLRRELATMTAQARLGLPRSVNPDMAQALKPYIDSRPNWREVEGAIKDAHNALKEIGIEPLAFEPVLRQTTAVEVKPARAPRERRANERTRGTEAERQAVDEIPF